MERELKPNSCLRRVVRAQDARALRRFYHGVLDPDPGGARNRIVSMTPLGDDAYLNAAFLRMDDKSEPLLGIVDNRAGKVAASSLWQQMAAVDRTASRVRFVAHGDRVPQGAERR